MPILELKLFSEAVSVMLIMNYPPRFCSTQGFSSESLRALANFAGQHSPKQTIHVCQLRVETQPRTACLKITPRSNDINATYIRLSSLT